MKKLNKNVKVSIVIGILIMLSLSLFVLNESFADMEKRLNHSEGLKLKDELHAEINKTISDAVGIGDSIKVMVIRGDD